MQNEADEIRAAQPDGWLIYKDGRGYYRPKAQGYTSNPAEAGRYTHAEAMERSHPNGWNGPRDGITIKHESEVPNAVAGPTLDALEAAPTPDQVQRARGYVASIAVTEAFRQRCHDGVYDACPEVRISLAAIIDGDAALAAEKARAEKAEAEVERLREALVDHNDRLRSAAQVAARDGQDTNWLSFRGQVHYTLAEHHDLAKEARTALEGGNDD